MGKGSGFEREMCKKISLWWTNQTRDDIFWRTSGSGARATTRFRRSNKNTYGNSGDLKAEDPIGKPFTDVFTVEMKRGYKSWSIMDQIDHGKKAAESIFSKFLKQTLMAANRPDCYNYPMLITRKDQHVEMVTIPTVLLHQLNSTSLILYDDWYKFEFIEYYSIDPELQFLNPHLGALKYETQRAWTSMKYEDFFSLMTPRTVLEFREKMNYFKKDYIIDFEAKQTNALAIGMQAVLQSPITEAQK